MLVDLRSCAFFSLLLSQAFCNPEGFQLVLGEAAPPSIDATGSFIIESGKNAVIQWDSFSIGELERVRFSQTDSHSVVLNRVMGGSRSALLGSLDSNGQVLLINPNGVLIGKDGLIQTAGFIASTADLSNEEFLRQGNLHFAADSSASIINLGAIECPTGDIILLARTVQNSGTLTALEGLVSLAVGAEILIQPDGEERVFIQPTESDFASLENSGDIHALAVEMKSGRSPYLYAIKSSGNISTPKFAEQNGKIYIVADTGRTDVSGSLSAEGGEVRILGEEVVIDNPLDIDVSSDAEGGTVLIGGDYKGENPEIPSASMTYVGPNTSIKADARTAGNGGKVILWSTDKTGFYGNISAQGGIQGGDGGLVEVSGGYLDYRGDANTFAALGKTGELLLDPVNVTIQSNGGVNTNGSFMQFDFVSITTMNTSTVDTSLLVGQLGTANVTISTAGTFMPTDNPGTITIASDPTTPLTWSSATTLTLIANDQISLDVTVNIMDVNIKNTNAGTTPFTAFDFQAGNGIILVSSVLPNASSSITTATGDIVLRGISSTASTPGIEVSGLCSVSSTGSGNIRMYGKGANTGPVSSLGIELSGLSAVSSASGEIVMEGIGGSNTGSQNHGIFLGPNAAVSTTGSGDIRMVGTGTGASAIGIQMESTSSVSSTGSSNIFMEGLGGSSTFVGSEPCIGIQMLGNTGVGTATRISTGGSIKLIGIGGPSTSTATGSCNGIQINDDTAFANAQIATTAGSIHLIGRGAGTGANNNGILIFNNLITVPPISSTATASDGATIILEGYGSINAAAADSNIGVAIQNCRMGIQTVDSDIIIIGNGGGSNATANGFNRGININSNPAVPNPNSLFGGTLIQATGVGNIVMNGFGGQSLFPSSASLSDGVAIANTPVPSDTAPIGQTQLLTASGSIFLNGDCIGQVSSGVAVTDMGTRIFPGGGGDLYVNGTSQGGEVSSGISGAESNPNMGQATFQVEDGGSIYLNGSATQDITLNKTAQNIGVYFPAPIEEASPNFMAVNGNITISGQGGVGIDFCPGVFLQGTPIQTNFGNITITGTAIATGPDNVGVVLTGQTTLATETPGPSNGQTGLISITGSGSVNGSDEAVGVYITDFSTITTNSYNVSISGTGGGQLGTATAGRTIDLGNHGVFFDGFTAISTVNGNIDISGSAAGNGDFNSGVVLLADTTGNPFIHSTGTNDGHINITGAASQNAMTGSNNVGVEIAWLNGPVANLFIRSLNHNITITGTGSQTSLMGTDNHGVTLRYLTPFPTVPLAIASATGSISINGYGGSGSTGGSIGVIIGDLGNSTDFAIIETASNTMTPPPGNISIFGIGGSAQFSVGVAIRDSAEINGQGSILIHGETNGIGGNNIGVEILGNGASVTLSDPVVGSFGQTLLIEGSGSKNSAATFGNDGVLMNVGIVSSTTKDISIIGYGGAQATSTDNNGLFIEESTVSSQSGNIFLYGVGGAGAGNETGAAFELITLTTTSGNIAIEGYGGSAATGTFNEGVQIGALITPSIIMTTTGNLSLYGVGGGGSDDNNGIDISGASISSTSGPISLIGYGSASTTGTNNDGITLSTITSSSSITNGSGNISFYGAGGAGTNDNIGVDFSAGTITTTSGHIVVEGYGGTGTIFNTGIQISNTCTTTSGNLSLYGVGGGTGGGSIGLQIVGGVINSTSGQMAFEGYGGTGNTGNHGIEVNGSSALSNSTGDISFYGVAGSGTFNNIGVDITATSTVTNGSGAIAIEGFGSPTGTGTGNHGIAVLGAAAVTTAASTGSISLLGIGGTGTGINHGVAIQTGTSAATPSQVKSGTGNLSITAESGSGSNSFGLDLDTFAQITAAGGNMFLLGQSNATAAATGGLGGFGIQMGGGSLIQQTAVGGVSNAVLNIFARGSTQAGSTNNIGLNMNATATTAEIVSGYSLVLIAESGLSAGTATDAIHLASNATITTNLGNLDITTLSVDAFGGSLTVLSNCTISGGGFILAEMTLDIANNFNIGSASITGPAEVLADAGTMTVNTKGNLTLTGGTGSNNFATLNTTTGSLTVTTLGNISLTGGSGPTALAVISTTTGPLNIRTIKNPLTGGGNVTLTGGKGPNAAADISTASTTIGGIAGHIMTVGGNLTLIGGTGLNATAQIGSPGISINTDILFPYIGGNLTLSGDSNAIIGHGLPSVGVSTLSGNITFQHIGGSVTLTGNTNAASVGGQAQIGHINQTAGGSTLSGNITITALGSITLTGGTQGTGSNARIGHGGQIGAATFGATDMVIAAGTNLILTTSSLASGVAVIANPHAAGRLTLITDNLNPLNPAVGTGGLKIDLNSQLTTTGTGHLRIYAAQQSTDSIPTGKIINGHAYTPAPVPPAGVDTSYETWNSYFGTHVYGGPEFNIFYKFPFLTLNSPCPPCPVPPPSVVPFQFYKLLNEELVATMAQLSDMLPIWDNPFHNEYPYLGGAFYHGQVCFKEDWEFQTDCAEYLLYSPYIDSDCYRCTPNAYRFRAVIFENEVY